MAVPADPRLYDLTKWHRALHQVTGDMALTFNRATADDLKRWAQMLRDVIEQMERKT